MSTQVAVTKTEQAVPNENCTFHPQISDHAKTLKRNQDDLYKWKLQQDMRKKEAQQKQEEELKRMTLSKTVNHKKGQQIIDRLYTTPLEGKKAILDEEKKLKLKKLKKQNKILKLQKKKKKSKMNKPLFMYNMTKEDRKEYRKALKDKNGQENPISQLLFNTTPQKQQNGLKLSISRSIFDSLEKPCLPNIVYYQDDQEKLELQQRLSAKILKTPQKCFFDLSNVKLEEKQQISDSKKKEALTQDQLNGLMERMERWQNQKQLKQTKKREQYDVEELDQCTFQPSLDKNQKQLNDGSPNKGQQSYQSYQDLYASKLQKNDDK